MNNKSKTKFLTQISLLTAIEVILAFTPLGFIMIPPVALTLLHIPVVVAAIVLGPVSGGILGGVFGVCSMIKATTAATSPVDMAFSPFLASSVGGNALSAIVMAFVIRILFGILTAFFYKAFSKLIGNDRLSVGLAGVLGTLMHTVMVLSFLAMFYTDLGVGFGAILATVASLNGILEIVSAALVAAAVCKPLIKYMNN